jgi:hypothetical protein
MRSGRRRLTHGNGAAFTNPTRSAPDTALWEIDPPLSPSVYRSSCSWRITLLVSFGDRDRLGSSCQNAIRPVVLGYTANAQTCHNRDLRAYSQSHLRRESFPADWPVACAYAVVADAAIRHRHSRPDCSRPGRGRSPSRSVRRGVLPVSLWDLALASFFVQQPWSWSNPKIVAWNRSP